MLFRAAAGAWEAGLTPGAVIRGLGPWGPGLIDKYVGGRFSYHGQQLTKEEIERFRWAMVEAVVVVCWLQLRLWVAVGAVVVGWPRTH